jgi:hypothetical protein
MTIDPSSSFRGSARQRVVDGLARLKEAFPLEARIAGAAAPVRAAYTELLRHWAGGRAPDHDIAPADMLTALVEMDAVALHPDGVSCHPFSARPTGIRVGFGGQAAHALCALHALAIPRLLGRTGDITAGCAGCGAALSLRVDDGGGLDHDQIGRATVWWKPLPAGTGHGAAGLHRNSRFLCPVCSAPPAELYTLPEAAAIGNAFFGFQRRLLAPDATSA